MGSVHLCNIWNFYTSYGFLGSLIILVLFNSINFAMPKKGIRDMEMNTMAMMYTTYRSCYKNFLRSRSHPSKCMFTLQIHPKITKSEKPSVPGVAMRFGRVMKQMNYQIHWQGNVRFWTQLCKWNCMGSSIKWTDCIWQGIVAMWRVHKYIEATESIGFMCSAGQFVEL